LQFSNDVVKVGYTSRPTERMRVHVRAARQMGGQVAQSWVSAPHANARENERRLIAFCAAKAPRTTGALSGEYFAGINFRDVFAFASSLPFDPVASAVKAADDEFPCEACDVVESRPLTAQGLLHQVAHGELRIVDRLGRDVSANWAGPVAIPMVPAQGQIGGAW
jgi:hypothetical protein